MDTSILIRAATSVTIRSSIFNGNGVGHIFTNAHVRATKIFKVIGGNYEQVSDDVLYEELEEDETLWFYIDPGSPDKSDTGYVEFSYDIFTIIANFRENYNEADLLNRTGYCILGTGGLYGPNVNSPVKVEVERLAELKITREYGGWYFVHNDDEFWIQKSEVTLNDIVVESPQLVVPAQPLINSQTEPVPIPEREKLEAGSAIKGTTLINMDESSGIKKLMASNLIFPRNDIRLYDKISRFGFFNRHDTKLSTREYTFFTKVDLNIFNNADISGGLNTQLSNIPIFTDAYEVRRHVLSQMQWSVDPSMPFNNLLINMCQSSIDLPGIDLDEVETSQNIYGTKISYIKGLENSGDGHSFSIDFEDTKFLETYMYFKLFDEYQKRKQKGEISPPTEFYTWRKILHDQCTIFKFIVSDDGMSLIYWAMLVGCYPKGVPRESFSDMSEGQLKYSIPWKAQFVFDMDPQILYDFNILVAPLYKKTKDMPLFDHENAMMDGRWATVPYIRRTVVKDAANRVRPEFKYFLAWRE